MNYYYYYYYILVFYLKYSFKVYPTTLNMTLIEQCILFQKINPLCASIEYLRSFLWRLLLHSLLVAFVVAAAVAAAAAALQTRRFSFDVARLLATSFKAP